jgi:GMP synthase (glutamine-hydrolysing)
VTTLLTVVHASWERPHRILEAFAGEVEVRQVEPLAGDPLPDHGEVDGVVAMGGPMGVDDTVEHPELEEEREWLAEAVDRRLPVLGVCLGAQLLARALGAAVRPGDRQEIGFLDIEVTDPNDPVVGALAPEATVLHWHGDVFDLPEGARSLASSAATEHQAFRYGNAWGVLFHPEADAAMVEAWLEVPEMVMEAGRAIGLGASALLPSQAEDLEADLLPRTARGFRAFAELVESP